MPANHEQRVFDLTPDTIMNAIKNCRARKEYRVVLVVHNFNDMLKWAQQIEAQADMRHVRYTKHNAKEVCYLEPYHDAFHIGQIVRRGNFIEYVFSQDNHLYVLNASKPNLLAHFNPHHILREPDDLKFSIWNNLDNYTYPYGDIEDDFRAQYLGKFIGVDLAEPIRIPNQELYETEYIRTAQKTVEELILQHKLEYGTIRGVPQKLNDPPPFDEAEFLSILEPPKS